MKKELLAATLTCLTYLMASAEYESKYETKYETKYEGVQGTETRMKKQRPVRTKKTTKIEKKQYPGKKPKTLKKTKEVYEEEQQYQ